MSGAPVIVTEARNLSERAYDIIPSQSTASTRATPDPASTSVSAAITAACVSTLANASAVGPAPDHAA